MSERHRNVRLDTKLYLMHLRIVHGTSRETDRPAVGQFGRERHAGNSSQTPGNQGTVPGGNGKNETNIQAEGNRTLLFTTRTCPNCRIAADSLEEAHIPYEKISAEENRDLVERYGVMQAPTLVVVRDGEVTKLANASNIRHYAKENIRSMESMHRQAAGR